MSSLLRRHPLASFLVVAYGLSWLCWLPVLDRIQSNPFKSDPDVILRLLIGGWGPTLAALICTGVAGGWSAVKALLGRFKLRGARKSLLAVALLWNPLVMAGAVGAFVLTGGELGYIHWPAFIWMPVMFLAVSIFGPLGEELGWRGIALPRLLERHGPVTATLILGVFWTFWHAPLMWAAAGTSISGQPVTLFSVLAYLISVTGSGFVFTWLHLRGKGSVLLAFLAHLSINGTGVFLGFLLPELGDNLYQLWLIGAGVTAGLAMIVARRLPRDSTHPGPA
jgi:membrane protease YdiL (CAAX protease family)